MQATQDEGGSEFWKFKAPFVIQWQNESKSYSLLGIVLLANFFSSNLTLTSKVIGDAPWKVNELSTTEQFGIPLVLNDKLQSKPNLNDKTKVVSNKPNLRISFQIRRYIYIPNNSLGRDLELCLMQSLAMWKMRALKWRIFSHASTPGLPFSVKTRMPVSAIVAIFTSCIFT